MPAAPPVPITYSCPACKIPAEIVEGRVTVLHKPGCEVAAQIRGRIQGE